MIKKFYFIVTDQMGEKILGIEEVTADMDEVEKLKDYDEKEGPNYLNNVSAKIVYRCRGVNDKELEYNSFVRSGTVSDTFLSYDSHEIIAWQIFGDEEWAKDHYPPQPDYYDYY